MFKLSRGAEYAIRGLLYLASEPEGKVSYIEEISRAQEVPKAYLAKIFQTLAKKGFVKSYRGPDGGFVLSKPASEIHLLDAIEAMEGKIFLNECLIHVGACKRDTICPIHDIWREAQQRLLGYLSECTFEDLAVRGKAKAAAMGAQFVVNSGKGRH
jgi:Rrf2 family protein